MTETTYYGIAFVATVAVSLTLAAVAWRRRSVPGSSYFALMMLSVGWWAFSYAMVALSEEQSLWIQLSTLGDCTMPVFFMLFALSYWRPDIRIRLQYQVLIWLIPVATVIIVLTNGLHGFLFSEIPPSVDNTNILLFKHGPWFYVTMTYDFLTMWIGVVFLFRAATSLSKIYQHQALIVLVAAVIPWIANALFLFNFSPVPGLNIAPIMASVTGLLLAFGIVKFQLFKVLPIAKEVVYKQLENGVLVVNYGGIIVDINPAARNMLGGDVEVGQNLKTALKNRLKLPLPLPAVHQRMEASFNDHEKPLWLDVVIAPLHDRRNQLSGHLIMLNDISERKLAEEALRHSEERFRQFIELLPEAVCEVDTFGNVLMANKRASLMSGYGRADLEKGLNIYAMIAPEDQGRAAANIQKKIAREILGADEYTLVRKDGSRFPALVHISDIVKDGKTTGFRCVIVDITERKRAEEALHRLAVIVESSHDAILSKTLDGIITTWNSGAEMLYGYKAEEVVGRPVSILVPPEFADEEMQFLEGIKRGEAVKDYETVRITKDKRRINILLTVSPLRDMSGNIIGASSIAQNITDLKQAAEIVKQSEKKYRELFENANEAIFVAQDAKLVFTNPMLTKLFGYSSAELSAKPFIEFIYPDDRGLVINRHQRRLLGEELPPVYAFRVIRRDGNVRWVELSAVVIEWEGKPATLNFLSDITEHRRMEEVLRQSEEKLRLTFESIADGIIIIDLAGKVVDVNEATLRIGGYKDKNQLIGRDAFDLIAPKDRKLVMDDLQERQEGRPKERMEYSIYPKDGRAFEGELTASTLRDENGNPVGYIAVVRDITERKRAEEELRKSEKKYRTLFNDSVDAVLVSTVDGRILDCNDAMSTLTLYRRDELLDLNAIRLYANPMDRENFVREIQKTGVVKEYEVKWVKKDGSDVDVVMTLTARHDADGNIVGYQGIVRDVTERKKIEQMKTDFVSFISHQLRTPVAGLMAYIDNMLEGIVGELNGKQIEYLAEMRDVCARGNRLIADLLNVSRLERGVLAVNVQPLNLRSVVDIAVKEYKESIKEKGLSLNIQEANRGIVVLADSDKLVEVLKNVIHNAYKFTKAGSISIEVSSEGNQGIVKIKDTGIGMTEATKKDLFKKEKVFGGAVAVGGGAGLGLYIAKGFMKLQHGDITAESVEGEGSTFIISLPRK